jgi:hypothetical protein
LRTQDRQTHNDTIASAAAIKKRKILTQIAITFSHNKLLEEDLNPNAMRRARLGFLNAA